MAPDVVLGRVHISGYERGLRPCLASTHPTLARSSILKRALQELLDVSEDVVAAVILDPEGQPKAATVGGAEAAKAAEIAAAMLAYGDALRTDVAAARLEAVTADGTVFVLREGATAIVAATGRDPVVGLVLHDLRTALRKVGRRTKARANASS